MAAISNVTMVNVQSHVHTSLDFPATGIVRLYGENSNGKSVLVKVLSDVVSNEITKPRVRNSIIRRGCQFCELTVTRTDGVALHVKIHREAAQTFAELRRKDEQPIRRYLADKSIPQLVEEFGLHYSPNAGVSINIHKDKDPLLFVSTKHAVNYELMGPSLSDPVAERSLATLENLYKESQRLKREMSNRLDVINAALETLQMWDIEEEQARQQKLAYLAYNLKLAAVPTAPVVEPVPDVHFVSIIPPAPKVSYPTLYEYIEPVPDILPLAREIKTLSEGVCPMCNRPF